MAKAASKRNTTAKRKTTAAKRSASKSRTGTKKNSRSSVVRDNVILISVTVLCILLFLSLVGLCGVFGSFANRVMFGLFGFLAYAVPVLLFAFTVFIYITKKKRGSYGALPVSVLLFVLVCLLLQLMTGDYQNGDGILPSVSYSIRYHRGGGLTGGSLEFVLRGIFGLIGAYIIDIAGILLCVVALTGKSFVAFIGRRSNQAYRTSKEAVGKKKEDWDTKRIERRELKEQMRMERIASGVSMDLTVEESAADVQEETGNIPQTSAPEEQGYCEYAPLLEAQTDDDPGEIILPFESGVSDSADTYEMQEASADSEASDAVFTEDEIPDVQIPADPESCGENPDEPAESASAVTAQDAAAAGAAVLSGEAGAQQEAPYVYPPLSLLHRKTQDAGDGGQTARQNMKKLQETLLSFGVDVTVTGYEQGPSVTRYELLPAAGVKVSKILSLTDDIKLALAAADVRIEAPIPGKSAIGIEVPNKSRITVGLRELIDTPAFRNHPSKIVFAAGKDISGNIILADIQKMPHLLIAGATGSGKSVCINTIIMSILYHADPKEVKLIMIDPKVVELSVYNGIPHLFSEVVTDPKKAAGALHWAVQEMTRRYQLFSEEHVRDIASYNEKARQSNTQGDLLTEVLPQIVIIVDELADLMMAAPHEVEDSICRLAQLARAAGLHLVIATQRPSVNVITGLIKANMPSRIAFSVSSGVDSRTILDMNGAEKLLGNGDMLYYPQGLSKPKRVQGAFVTDEEVSAVVKFLKENNEAAAYHDEVASTVLPSGSGSGSAAPAAADARDELYVQAGRFLIESEKGSIGSLQRKFRIGFNRAARIVDQLTEDGVLGPEEGTKAREILMTAEEFEMQITGEGLNNDAAD